MTENKAEPLAADPCGDNHQQTGIDRHPIRLTADEALLLAGGHVDVGLAGYLDPPHPGGGQ